jgi:hypothetical protein
MFSIAMDIRAANVDEQNRFVQLSSIHAFFLDFQPGAGNRVTGMQTKLGLIGGLCFGGCKKFAGGLTLNGGLKKSLHPFSGGQCLI